VRSFVINYSVGHRLVREHVEARGGTADRPEKRWREFDRLSAFASRCIDPSNPRRESLNANRRGCCRRSMPGWSVWCAFPVRMRSNELLEADGSSCHGPCYCTVRARPPRSLRQR
jgi:hypothetical protein